MQGFENRDSLIISQRRCKTKQVCGRRTTVALWPLSHRPTARLIGLMPKTIDAAPDNVGVKDTKRYQYNLHLTTLRKLPV